MIKIITDSSADLPNEVIEKYNIKVVPLTVTIGNQDYLEGKDYTGRIFFKNVFGIKHTGNIEEAEQVKQELIRLFQPKDIIVNYMGAVMGTYAGKDGMIISF